MLEIDLKPPASCEISTTSVTYGDIDRTRFKVTSTKMRLIEQFNSGEIDQDS